MASPLCSLYSILFCYHLQCTSVFHLLYIKAVPHSLHQKLRERCGACALYKVTENADKQTACVTTWPFFELDGHEHYSHEHTRYSLGQAHHSHWRTRYSHGSALPSYGQTHPSYGQTHPSHGRTRHSHEQARRSHGLTHTQIFMFLLYSCLPANATLYLTTQPSASHLNINRRASLHSLSQTHTHPVSHITIHARFVSKAPAECLLS